MNHKESECIKVAVRVRPLVQSEIARGCAKIVSRTPNQSQIALEGGNMYTFDNIFTEEDSQQDIYELAVDKLVLRLFEGYNVTILAYGQTGSGKTYTMGTVFDGNQSADTGVIPRAIDRIFQLVEENKTTAFTLSCSFMELYKEQLYDLLSQNNREKTVVELREENKEVVVPNLTEKTILSAREATQWLMHGSAGRATGSTAMNSESSRSHSIFTINITMQNQDEPSNQKRAKFHLVDLAGSERPKKTKATGDRFLEGVKINHGLFALGNVISALGNGKENTYISYRDSKLTRLLQDSLGGNSITLMIACVSPADYNHEETGSTLRYADRAKQIKNKPIVNQNPYAVEINHLKEIIQNLRVQLLHKSSSDGGAGHTGNLNETTKMYKEQISELLLKNTNYQKQLQFTLNDIANTGMRAHLAETAQDELAVRLQAILKIASEITELYDRGITNDQDIEHLREKHNHLEKLLNDLNALLISTSDEMHNINMPLNKMNEIVSAGDGSVDADPDGNCSIDDNHKIDSHTTRQFGMTVELHQLNEEIALKEELFKRFENNYSTFCSYNGGEQMPTDKLKRYEETIETLERERNELLEKLSAKMPNASAKLAEERRRRLQQLEQEIIAAKKMNVHQAKLLKMREKDSKMIDNLTNEIRDMKATKIKLIRAMRVENDGFRVWKMKREKEVCRLKEVDRKRQNEIVRMEILHTKQTNVLQRQVEEGKAVNRRLKEALEKQHRAQLSRKQHSANRMDRFAECIEHEVEVISSIVGAKVTLDQLMVDRGIVTNQLSDMKAAKASQNDIKTVQDDIDLRNAQITDLRQKVTATSVEDKIKLMCDNVHSMIESKTAMKTLLETIVKQEHNMVVTEHKLREITSQCDIERERAQNLEYKLTETLANFADKLAVVQKANEEKIMIYLRELQQSNSDGECQWKNDVIDELDKCRAELEELKAEKKNGLSDSSTRTRSRTVLKLAGYQDEEILDTDHEMDNLTLDPNWSPNSKKDEKSRPESLEQPTRRASDGKNRCACKGSCITNKCSCKKSMFLCSASCKCTEACLNNDSNNLYDNGNDENDDPELNSSEHTPKKLKMDETRIMNVTTPSYPFGHQKKNTFYNL